MCIPILRKNQKNRDPTFLTYRTWNIGQRYKVRSSGFLTHIEYAEYQRNRFGNIGLLHSEPANILGGGDIHPPLCSRGLNIFWLKIPQISWHAVCSQFNGAYFVWNTFSPKWIALGWKLRKFQKKIEYSEMFDFVLSKYYRIFLWPELSQLWSQIQNRRRNTHLLC